MQRSVKAIRSIVATAAIVSALSADRAAAAQTGSSPSHYVSGGGVTTNAPPMIVPAQPTYVGGGGVSFTPNPVSTPPNVPAYATGGGVRYTPYEQQPPPAIDRAPHYATSGGVSFTPHSSPPAPPIDTSPHYATSGGISFAPAPLGPVGVVTPPESDGLDFSAPPRHATGGSVSFTPSPTVSTPPVGTTPHYGSSGGVTNQAQPTLVPARQPVATGGGVTSSGSAVIAPRDTYASGGAVVSSPPALTLGAVLSSPEDKKFLQSLDPGQRRALNQYSPQDIQTLQQRGLWPGVRQGILSDAFLPSTPAMAISQSTPPVVSAGQDIWNAIPRAPTIDPKVGAVVVGASVIAGGALGSEGGPPGIAMGALEGGRAADRIVGYYNTTANLYDLGLDTVQQHGATQMPHDVESVAWDFLDAKLLSKASLLEKQVASFAEPAFDNGAEAALSNFFK